jgi:Zn-dependent metalloprotease
MKANMKLCSIVLSAGIIASSILPAFAAQSTESYIPKVSSNNYESGFISGKLTEKSKESPEKIVEKNYNKVFLPSAGKMLVKQSKEDKQFKKDEQFKNSKGRTVVKTTQTYNGVPIFGTEQNFHINDEGIIECIVGSTVGDMENKLASSASNIQTSKQDALSAVENHLVLNRNMSKS